MKIINHGQHIYMHEDNEGRPCVTADDFEIFDMLEDFLTEDCDFDFESSSVPDWPVIGEHTIMVESGITFSELVESVQKLDLNEIERIYLLNNAPRNG